jgi:hypothetical protein
LNRLRLSRLVAPFLALAPLVARAQEEVVSEEGGGGGGSPYYGYIGVGVIIALSIFAICKSARR